VVEDAAQTGLALQIKPGITPANEDNSTMKTITLAAAILLAGATAAGAADLGRGSSKDEPAATTNNWAGPGIAVGLGGTFANTEASIPGVSLSGIGSSGVEGVASGWYHFQSGGLVFGPAVEARFGNVGSELKVGSQSAGFDVDYRIAGLARLGVANGSTLVYATGGVETMHVSGTGLLTGSKDFLGWTAGGGIMNKRDGGLVIGLEARYTEWESKDFGPVTVSPDGISATASVGWQF
jgi:outer membrane immunogenic protein